MKSKLPNAGLSIFAIMTKMANESNAINLAQGFPDFDVSPELIAKINDYMEKGFNQYAPVAGQPALRSAIANKIGHTYGVSVDANEVTVTSGATQALFNSISAIVGGGDEVIYFDPAYDSYKPVVELNGGVPVAINLRKDDFSIPWDEVEKRITKRTKLIIINTPHNPSGALLNRNDLDQLADLIRGKDTYVLSDEVYEHLVFDEREHESILKHPELRKVGVAVYSFGKTFHATGWKMGYSVAPLAITSELQKVHQFVVFSVTSATQMAIADYLSSPAHYDYLPSFFQEKRDFFLDQMKTSRFKALPCSGTYFQTFSYEGISDLSDMEMAEWMTKTHGVATVPFSPFYSDGSDHQYLRICFAKGKETLKLAAEKLCQI